MFEYYPGRFLEKDLVGGGASKVFIERLKQKGDKKNYLSFADSLSLIRETYQGDPTNPDKELPRDLFVELRDKLGLLDEETEGDRLKFFSAIGTPLDIFHGVDCWFEFVNPGGRCLVVTVDITQNIESAMNGEKNKADLIIVETKKNEIIGTEQRFQFDDREVSVVFVSVADSTSKSYLDGVDLLVKNLERIFLAKGIIFKKIKEKKAA